MPCAASLSTAANLSHIHSFTIVEYTIPEYIDMVLVYGEAAGNGRVARCIYQQRYAHLVTLSLTLFRQSYSTGKRGTFTVNRADCGAPRKRCSPSYEEDVLHRVDETPEWVYLITVREVLHE